MIAVEVPVEGETLEALLRRSESELRLAVDTIPTMAWITRPDGHVQFLNRRWLEYSGLTLDQAIEQSNNTMHPDDFERVLEKWRCSMAEAAPFEDKMRLRRHDGQYRWFLVRTVPLFGSDGKVLRWYGTSTDIEDLKRAEEALREAAVRLQSLSRRLLTVQEEERRHLSRELHDEFGQILAAINLHLHAARATAGEAAQSSLEESISLLQRAGERVRGMALELRPGTLDTVGLDGTLRWLAQQHQQRTGTSTEVVGQWSEVDGDAAIACFRVVQEALTNAAKHARARHVWIEMGEDDDSRHLTVRDDGAGFDVAWTMEHAPGAGHLGLLGMRERVQILGGTLRIDSQPGRGVQLRVRLPLERNARVTRTRRATSDGV
jgi:two-component system sensor histidine kinase UhpB